MPADPLVRAAELARAFLETAANRPVARHRVVRAAAGIWVFGRGMDAHDLVTAENPADQEASEAQAHFARHHQKAPESTRRAPPNVGWRLAEA